MEQHAKEQDVQRIEHITKRYVPIDVGGAISRWYLSVILSFGKVLPALLGGDTVVLRPSPFTPLTVLRLIQNGALHKTKAISIHSTYMALR
jgi:acyl-CoA reductase-like NAD-dependent aldehyde dehydrogenase